jgi:anti-anti-sigma factor
MVERLDTLVEVTSRTYGATAEICVRGEIDITSISSLSAPLELALQAPWARIVVDLGGVSFLESQCIELLADTAQRARTKGVSFVVHPPEGEARRHLDLVGLS